jgi:uncharacterized protein (DUF433 family)
MIRPHRRLIGTFKPDDEHSEGAIYYRRFSDKPSPRWSESAQSTQKRPDIWTVLARTGIISEAKRVLPDEEVFQKAAAAVGGKIQLDRKILGGAPCVAGTRIPVYAILQLVEAGYTHKRILKSFPSLSKEELEAALRFATLVMER